MSPPSPPLISVANYKPVLSIFSFAWNHTPLIPSLRLYTLQGLQELFFQLPSWVISFETLCVLSLCLWRISELCFLIISCSPGSMPCGFSADLFLSPKVSFEAPSITNIRQAKDNILKVLNFKISEENLRNFQEKKQKLSVLLTRNHQLYRSILESQNADGVTGDDPGCGPSSRQPQSEFHQFIWSLSWVSLPRSQPIRVKLPTLFEMHFQDPPFSDLLHLPFPPSTKAHLCNKPFLLCLV